MTDKPSTRLHLRGLLLTLLLMPLLQACEQTPQSKYNSVDYNVILISIDTLRADHLGVYGYDKDTSPLVDKFAADSIRFTTAIAQAPSTLPSHASLFTGMIPVNHGAFAALQSAIKTEIATLSEIMRDAGYRTISFNGGGLVNGRYGFSRGFERYVTDRDNDLFRDKVNAATEWLDQNEEDKFFIFLHTYEVHDPYNPSEEYLALFESNYTGPLTNDIGSQELAKINSGKIEISQADVQHVINAYDAEIRSMDDAMGDLVDYLKENDLYDNTLIIFTSDHGEEFGEHGAVGRHFFTLYDELLKVPFIIKMPNSQLAGTVLEDQVSGVDLLPTLLDILDINYSADFDGQSLAPLIMGADTEALVAISQQDTSDVLPPTSIRKNDRKLILRPNILGDKQVPDVWVKDKYEFNSDATTITVPIASVDGAREIRVKIDGRQVNKFSITPERVNYPIALRIGGQPGDAEQAQLDKGQADSAGETLITLESKEPCAETASGCMSFRIFNPQEFYTLDIDKSELNNLYHDPELAEEIDTLRQQLNDKLSRRDRGESRSIQLDDEIQRQLKSLGYLN